MLDLSAWEPDDFPNKNLTEFEPLNIAEAVSLDASASALWLYLVSKLVQLTVDDRDEVRHSQCSDLTYEATC